MTGIICNAYLVGVVTRALPALNFLETAIRFATSGLAFRPHVGALVVTFDSDMVVTGDPELLSGQVVVTLPDL